MTELQGFHHAAITVRDLEASVRWYASVLGFEEMFREESDGANACVMRFPAGSAGAGLGIGLVEHRANDGTPFDPARLGLDHLAFAVASQEALDEWAQRLTAAGVTHSGAIAVPPGAILNFKDPDGIALALFWDR